MPFIGRDWRADGDQWIKTEIGSWERSRRISLSSSSINLNSSLSDTFNALDLANSVSNIRRFNYIVKVVQILFKEKLGELSGNAQRSLFQVLERIIDTVCKTGDNISLMQRMITQFLNSIHSAYPFYYYIGSELLWRQNIEMLIEMKEKLKYNRINLFKINDDNNKLTFDYLPIEIKCEIIKKFDNGKDIIHIGMINTKFYHVTQELLIWKQLCLYHFSDQTQNSKNIILGDKILGLIKRQYKDIDIENIDWKKIYFKLKRRYGLREIYAEMIYQCQLCKSLFWQESNHSCLYKTRSPSFKPLTPRKFVNMLI